MIRYSLTIATALLFTACSSEIKLTGQVTDSTESRVANDKATLVVSDSRLTLLQGKRSIIQTYKMDTKALGQAVEAFDAGQSFRVTDVDNIVSVEGQPMSRELAPIQFQDSKSCTYAGYCYSCFGKCQFGFSPICSGLQDVLVEQQTRITDWQLRVYRDGRPWFTFQADPLTQTRRETIETLSTCR